MRFWRIGRDELAVIQSLIAIQKWNMPKKIEMKGMLKYAPH